MIERELLMDLRAEIKKIAREEVKKAIQNEIEELPPAQPSATDTNVATIQPEQRWIPFSERRPWEGQQILVCAEDGVMWMTVFRSCIGFSGAWLPMPEPYKEDDNG